MANLKCTVAWLVLLLAHLDLKLIQSFPRLSFNITKCPVSDRLRCPQFPNDLCQNDQDCEASHPGKGLKCCGDCEKSCVTPEVLVVKITPVKLFKRLKPRTRLVAKCPIIPHSSDSPPGPEQECQNDAVCDDKFPGQDLKCCKDGDDFRCMAPVVESLPPTPDPFNGTCPVFDLEPAECPPFREHRCYNDQQCADKHPGLGLKCCPYDCELSCLSPVPWSGGPRFPVYGTCPVFPDPPECPTEPDHECNNDQKCAELHPGLGLKCCRYGCDMVCVVPIPP